MTLLNLFVAGLIDFYQSVKFFKLKLKIAFLKQNFLYLKKCNSNFGCYRSIAVYYQIFWSGKMFSTLRDVGEDFSIAKTVSRSERLPYMSQTHENKVRLLTRFDLPS